MNCYEAPAGLYLSSGRKAYTENVRVGPLLLDVDEKGGHMKRYLILTLILTVGGCDDDNPTAPSGPSMSFFVTSVTSVTGNLGGLAGADATCQRLGASAGQGSRTWRAYPECGTGFRQRQSAGERARPDRHRAVVTTPTSRSSPTTWPSCTRAPAMPRCFSTSAGSASTVSGPARQVRSSTTSSPGRMPMEHSFPDPLARIGHPIQWRWRHRWVIRTGWVRARAQRARCRRGTRRTPA